MGASVGRAIEHCKFVTKNITSCYVFFLKLFLKMLVKWCINKPSELTATWGVQFHINGLKSLHLPLILKFNRDRVLLLRRLDPRLSKDLPSDLQKLRCEAAFEALKFSLRVMEIWKKLAERLRSKCPYITSHL
ncbi:unnamed protein product [Brassica rapa subsp. narinosa]